MDIMLIIPICMGSLGVLVTSMRGCHAMVEHGRSVFGSGARAEGKLLSRPHGSPAVGRKW